MPSASPWAKWSDNSNRLSARQNNTQQKQIQCTKEICHRKKILVFVIRQDKKRKKKKEVKNKTKDR